MRTTEEVLNLVQQRGTEGKPLERIYRLLKNPNLYLSAYGKIYRNQGAMTPGTSSETVDGMSLAKIEGIIEKLNNNSYEFSPTRRIHIPKKKGTRPLGIPTWSDKLLTETVRLILESYYEPQMSRNSHGFRPEKGSHTALRQIQNEWTGVVWIIEGDIKGFFDNVNHEKLLEILARNVKDEQLIKLIRKMLEAGYMDKETLKPSWKGTPQGGIISPLLANIYLNELDKYIENRIAETNSGKEREVNPEWKRRLDRAYRYRKRGNEQKARELEKEAKVLSSSNPMDPEFRRMKYIRYADDFVIGYIGTREEAEQIKEQIRNFLKEELNLELSEDKTLITHASSERARFLGYEIDTQNEQSRRVSNGRRSLRGKIKLRIPKDVLAEKAGRYLDTHRDSIINDEDYSIVETFASEYRGIVEYYKLARNVRELSTLKHRAERQLVGTLAKKHKISVKQVYRKYKEDNLLVVQVERPGKEPLRAVWGEETLSYRPSGQQKPQRRTGGTVELVKRLLAEKCEWCGTEGKVEVHHIRALKDLSKPGRKEIPEWMRRMSARKRKTMVLCEQCHDKITHGKPLPQRVQ
jgi:group II intron reverse transcriptase/maturase